MKRFVIRTLITGLILCFASTAFAGGWRRHTPTTVVYPSPAPVVLDNIFPAPTITSYWYKINVPTTTYYRVNLRHGIIYQPQPVQPVYVPVYDIGRFTWSWRQRVYGY